MCGWNVALLNYPMTGKVKNNRKQGQVYLQHCLLPLTNIQLTVPMRGGFQH